VNLAGNEVEVCRRPSGDQYASITHVGRDRLLEPELLPGATIPAAVLIG
jgi:hypothetical protein